MNPIQKAIREYYFQLTGEKVEEVKMDFTGLQELGVRVIDENGEFSDAESILQDISNTLNSTQDNQKTSLNGG